MCEGPSGRWRFSRGCLAGLGERWSLALIALGGAILIALLWAGVLYKTASELELEEQIINAQTMSLARAFEEHTARTLGEVDQALRFVKFQYEKEGDAFDLATAVEQKVIDSRFFNQVGMINAEGTYHLSNVPDFKRVDLRDREHFRVHVERDSQTFFVSKPVLGRVSKKWSVQVTRRINRPDGSFGGVAVISLDPLYFTSVYSEVDLGQYGSVTLVGQDGVVRARRVGNVVGVGQDVSGTPLFQFDSRPQSGHASSHSPIDGRLRMYSYRKLEYAPLAVIVGADREEALAAFVARRNTYFGFAWGMSAIIAGFCALSLWLVMRQLRIARRLAEMRVRADSANRLKSEFLAMITHELRTPLNGIIGYAELVEDGLEDPTARSYARTIFDSSRHLLMLLNAVLDLTQLEAGKLHLRYSTEHAHALASSACATHQAMATRAGLALEYRAPPDLEIECDRTRVLQILNNLLDNAIKFTACGGVSLTVRQEGAWCVFEVRDSGCGIAPEQHDTIFERFRQGQDFETRKHGGTGLGLALCRELAELMGGTVRVESQVGKGSTFRFVLPLLTTEGSNASSDC